MKVNTTPSPIDPTLNAPVVKAGQGKTLGADDFMKLLAVQFQSQDPMKPMEDTAFIAQMAQFTSLSQSQAMTAEMVKLTSNQQAAAANSFLGKQVTFDNGDGTTTTGNVSAVQMEKGVPYLVTGDAAYSMDSVLFVEPGVTSTPTPTAVADSKK